MLFLPDLGCSFLDNPRAYLRLQSSDHSIDQILLRYVVVVVVEIQRQSLPSVRHLRQSLRLVPADTRPIVVALPVG